MTARYELGTAPPARRALAERLSFEIAAAAATSKDSRSARARRAGGAVPSS